MKMLYVAGEQITAKEAGDLVKMICKDAEKFAGEFFGMNRSVKFRANWPNEYDFAEANWKTFVEPVRAIYAERLGDPKTPPEDARKMHLALVLQAMMGAGQETDNRLQIRPDSQQFVGDRYENKKIIDRFGTNQNLRAGFLNSAARIARQH